MRRFGLGILVLIGIGLGIAAVRAALTYFDAPFDGRTVFRYGHGQFADARNGVPAAPESELQHKVQQALERELTAAQLTSGSAAVMEVSTGKIVALAKVSGKGATELEAVPMGSTIKPLTVLVGLQEGLLRREDHFDDQGTYQYNGQTVSNQEGKANGDLTASLAIEMSSNTFMAAKVAVPLYNKYSQNPGTAVTIWKRYLSNFGLGNLADFDAEAARKGDLSALVNASWGQNERFTVLELVQYAATLANHGTRMKLLYGDRDEPRVLSRSSLPQSDWDLLLEGMSGKVEPLDELPFRVARKTGTSTEQKNGNTAINSLCIAYAPAESPKIAVAAAVPGGGLGSGIASRVAAASLRSALMPE
ncbi:penicillin-binding transpeptidase domain-containing protein [Gordoniibacillus kamchatkensis]|uniref:penicillin-binding transpeptidase domain-containing protein n=1 Tax=Gordoniibacillus kamchatkensis TaxID=1590651 RepID=UPI0006980FEB|nr:penicillin-binding transpeptidase domain-containing protein [Paenibacillus sp. VKM B-2647]